MFDYMATKVIATISAVASIINCNASLCRNNHDYCNNIKNHCRELLQRYYLLPLLTQVILSLLQPYFTVVKDQFSSSELMCRS
jgi:hypothetical protein